MKLIKQIKLLFLLLVPLLGLGTNYQVSDLREMEDKEKELSPGDSVFLENYIADDGVKLERIHDGEVVFIFNSVEIDSKRRFTLELSGKNITAILTNCKITGGRDGTIGVVGDYIKVLGENTTITDAGTGMLLLGTNHYIGGLDFVGLRSVGIDGNNLKLDPETKKSEMGFHWGRDNNWRITNCRFRDIYPIEPNMRGGGIKLVPNVRVVKIDNCDFDKIGGNALWLDHYDDDIGIYYNSFSNIEKKCIFLEIGDPNPEKPIRGAKVAGNISRGNEKHGCFVAASSDVEIFGNYFEGWPVVIHGMPREFYRRYGGPNARDQWVKMQGTLNRNKVYKNVLRPTESRNHLMIYTGNNSSNNTIEGNYYVTGFTSNFKNTAINSPHFGFPTGTFLHGIDQSGLGVDPDGVAGPTPKDFPFPEVFSKIPVAKTNPKISYEIDDLPADTTKTDTLVISLPVVDPEKPKIWIISDLSSGRTDPDDRVSAAMVLLALDQVDLKGFSVGSHKWNLSGSLQDWFNPNLGNAYAQEQSALNSRYGGFPEVLPMHEAITTGQAFKEGEIDQLSGSLKSMWEAAEEVTHKGDKFYVLLWGPQNEAAYFADFAMRQTDQRVFLNTIFISHASSPSNLNNCSRDADACAFLHNLAAQGKIKFYEMGFSGKVIDNKTFPKLSNDVLKSKIASFFQEKWQNQKPDGSDGFIFFAAFVKEVGGGLDYLETLKSDGTSNEEKLMNDFQKGPIYNFLERRASVAASGKTDNTNQPGKGLDPLLLEQTLSELLDKVDALRSTLIKLIDAQKK
jgi:hypothetical protein